MTILIVAPLLGSLITEAAAMTIARAAAGPAVLRPATRRRRLRYATLGLLFVNVSIGGTLTHFAAPPVLMVASAWGWDTPFMLSHFGWRAAAAIVISTVAYALVFRREFAALAARRRVPEVEIPAAEDADGRPALLPDSVVGHGRASGFMAWSVAQPALPGAA